MARPLSIFKRQLISFNPNFRIDTANPQMGSSGTDVYKIYGVTDDGDNQSSISLSSSGLFGIYNDHTIQISGGTKNEEGRDDIVIIGNNGNVTISANGMIRIYGTNIMLEAEQDIHLKAGRNINLQSGSGRVMLDALRLDTTAISGNLITQIGLDFAKKVFSGSVAGTDFLSGAFGSIANNVVNNFVPL